jgi:hypothetical protein
MTNTPSYDLLSFKYVAASFFATYFSGVTHPLDLIKTRFQSNVLKYSGHDGRAGNGNLVPQYSGVRGALKAIYRDEGLKGLFKGFYISLLCQASSMSFFFWR